MAVLTLTLQGVGLTLGRRTVLRDIDHAFTGSGTSVLLGHNGAGKTMLMKICHGLIAPSTGRVIWQDPARAAQPQVQAMVFQKPVLLRRSVAANIRHVLRSCGFDRAEAARRIHQALDMAGLTAMAERPARQLSGGEQQRLALARAWAVRPEVLILDEPCTSLDPGATREVEEIITAFHDAGTKIILATHDLTQARRLAGDVVFLHEGTIVEAACAETFFDRPTSAQARAFLEGRLWTPGSAPNPEN